MLRRYLQHYQPSPELAKVFQAFHHTTIQTLFKETLMRIRAPLALVTTLLACTLAQAEGFTAYFVQRINNGQLSKQVTCEVLSMPNPSNIQGRITAKSNAVDFDGKPVSAALVLADGFPVSADWDSAKGCNNEGVPQPVPAALLQIPAK